MGESTDVKLARIEEGLVALRGEIRTYHKEIVGPMVKKVEDHHGSITVLKRDRFWVSSLAGIVFSWIGLKVFGKT